MAKRSLSENILTERIGIGWDGLIDHLASAGVSAQPGTELYEYLNETFGLPRWWQITIAGELDKRLGGGKSNRQRNGLYRQTAQCHLSKSVDELFDRFCNHLATWLELDPAVRLAEGVRLRTHIGMLLVTDVDDIGWVRLVREQKAGESVIHCCFRQRDVRTHVSFAESNLPSQAMCYSSSMQWLSVLDALSKG